MGLEYGNALTFCKEIIEASMRYVLAIILE
jgi:hypothetical protein